MKHIDEFRDPRVHPVRGDKVSVDLGDGDVETRTVAGIERHASGNVVKFHVDNDTAHTRSMKLNAWRQFIDESTVLDRGLG